MTETPASSRVTQRDGTRSGNGAGGGRASHGAAGLATLGSKPGGSGPDTNGTDTSARVTNGPVTNGGARYSEADLEAIRARLAAFARGDFRPRTGPDDRHPAAAGPVLAEI